MKRICTLTLLAAALGAGCVADDGAATAAADLCVRLDDCNYLDGISVQECTDNRNRCGDSLDASQRADWEQFMDECLSLQSCSLFGDCWLDVPWC